jgi:hypothetical protein
MNERMLVRQDGEITHKYVHIYQDPRSILSSVRVVLGYVDESTFVSLDQMVHILITAVMTNASGLVDSRLESV